MERTGTRALGNVSYDITVAVDARPVFRIYNRRFVEE